MIDQKAQFQLALKKGLTIAHNPAPGGTTSENTPAPDSASHQGKPGPKHPEPSYCHTAQYTHLKKGQRH
jgi:hypothetical protein